MTLILSDQDLVDLNTFAMEHFRGREIAALQNWLNNKQMRQMAANEAKPKPPADPPESTAATPPSSITSTNGHDANPYDQIPA